LGDGFAGDGGPGAGLAPGGDGRAIPLRLKRFCERLFELGLVADGDDAAEAGLGEHIGDAADVVSDDGGAAAEGFVDDVGPALAGAGQD